MLSTFPTFHSVKCSMFWLLKAYNTFVNSQTRYEGKIEKITHHYAVAMDINFSELSF